MRADITYDIAIIGGGLAGLCMAIQAAEASYSVILFEKEVYPYHKVCGEYISLESRDFLQRLGVPLDEWQVPVINKLQTTDTSGKSYNFRLPLGGFGISRYKLDNKLYELAIAKGVVVKCATKVTDVVKKENLFITFAADEFYQSKIAVGSFGKRSNLDLKWSRKFTQDKQTKLSNYIGVKYHIRYQHARDTIALHNFSDGYCGISAIEDGLSCLCYLTTAKNLQNANNSIAKMEQQILSVNPVLERIFSTAEFIYEKPLVISQVSFADKTQMENGLLLVGDSAGLITPLCGNGMSMAMHSSKIAFLCIQKFLNGNLNKTEMEQAYAAEWKKMFATRLWIGRNVQRVFGGSHTTSIFLKVMNAVPAFSRQLIKATHGKSF